MLSPHKTIFAIGWIYYLALPFLVLDIAHRLDLELFSQVADYSHFESEWYWYLPIVSMLMLFSFLFGSSLGSLSRSFDEIKNLRYSFSQFILPSYFSLFLYYVFKSSDQLFSGYSQGVETEISGAFSTMQMLLIFHYLVCRSIKDNIYTKSTLFLLLLNSVILLGLGGRLYVLTAIVSIIVFLLLHKDRKYDWSKSRILFFSLITFIVLVGLGMWRVADYNLSNIIFYGLAESFFTYISAVTYIQGGDWYLFAIPVDFFNGFINIIPTALFPEKQQFMISLIDVNESIMSPYGAISIAASAVGNFGMVGAIIFFIGIGVFFEKLRANIGDQLVFVCYCYLCGLLPFMFFRDPFQIQGKVVLTGFILVGFYALIQLLANSLRKQKVKHKFSQF